MGQNMLTFDHRPMTLKEIAKVTGWDLRDVKRNWASGTRKLLQGVCGAADVRRLACDTFDCDDEDLPTS